MRIFVDANIIVSVLNKEYPLFTHASRIISLADYKQFTVYTSPVCLAIAFYFAEKKFKASIAKQKISILCENIEIASASAEGVLSALKDNAVKDFEDGIEYYAALESNCDCIITEDVHDFYFSKIEVLKSKDFFLKYMSGKTH